MAGSSGIQPGVHLFAAVTISRSAGRRDTRGRVRLAPCANGARPQVPDDGSTVWRSWTARPQTRPDCLQRRFDRAPLKRPRSDGLVRRRAEDGLDCLPHPRRASLSFPSAERHLDRRLIHQSTKWGLPPSLPRHFSRCIGIRGRLLVAQPAKSLSVFCQKFVSVRALFVGAHVVPCHHSGMKKPPNLAVFQSLRSGAGEGIRTLDPNLGKVVLYP
jgi:hypothetical protein